MQCFSYAYRTMKTSEQQQLYTLLANREENKKVIPTFSDLTTHPIFWATFAAMNPQQKQEVQELINEYIATRVPQFNKTKWGQLFLRFFESQPEIFRRFRELNENEQTVATPEFQTIGKQVEQELFRLEGILTDKMINQEKGLDKVVDAFYAIVYLFFPRFNFVE